VRARELEVELTEGEAKTGLEIELDSLVALTGRIVERGTAAPVADVRVMATSASGELTTRLGERSSVSDEHGRFTIPNVLPGAVRIIGLPAGGRTSSYVFLRLERNIEGSGTIDLGDLEIEKPAGSGAGALDQRRGSSSDAARQTSRGPSMNSSEY
jgi:hypothetical protein